ncbi:hypothetical protein K4F52_001618 [Lecanicillium sp. MT-2017a]|nr:hypothetical protein K4F52_001618 [Lecanicillium sp. MT-2017a]
MEPSHPYSRQDGDKEHIIQLPNNRQLAYACNGPVGSKSLVIFFSGLMSVGNASDVPIPCRDRGMRWIAPTLVGFGNSSSRDPAVPYHETLAKDMTALLAHLYPDGEFESIILAGGSYGTVPAQMLYGAPYELFPAGRKIAGCVLLAGFSPFKYDKAHSQQLSWQNWMSIGAPSRLPFRPLQRLFRLAISSKMGDVEGAKVFLHDTLLGMMDAQEKEQFQKWLVEKGRSESEFIEKQAKGAVRSCENWDGFMEVSDVIHSDWGFNPATLDTEHASKPVLVVSSENDQLGGSNNDWLCENYKAAKHKKLPGGHISSLYYLDEIMQEIIGDCMVPPAARSGAAPVPRC